MSGVPAAGPFFADDGVEGHDSRIKDFITPGLVYADANAVCASEYNTGHLITFANPASVPVPDWSAKGDGGKNLKRSRLFYGGRGCH